MTTTTREYVIGRLEDGSRVSVGIHLQPVNGPVQDIHHRQVEGEMTRLSISGLVIEPHQRDASEAGQMLGRLLEITKPAPGWRTADIFSLHTIWERWHLNDLNAACAHMDVDYLATEDHQFGPGGRRIITGRGNPCPVSDYGYGQAWLYEPLPDHVLTEVRRLQGLLT